MIAAPIAEPTQMTALAQFMAVVVVGAPAPGGSTIIWTAAPNGTTSEARRPIGPRHRMQAPSTPRAAPQTTLAYHQKRISGQYQLNGSCRRKPVAQQYEDAAAIRASAPAIAPRYRAPASQPAATASVAHAHPVPDRRLTASVTVQATPTDVGPDGPEGEDKAPLDDTVTPNPMPSASARTTHPPVFTA